MTEVATNAAEFSTEQLIAAAYHQGQLRPLLQPHQVDDYDDFRAWNEERQSRDYMRRVRELGALYDNLWVDECGRRLGKTSRLLVIAHEEMLRRPGARGMIATPLAKAIGGIIVPLTKILFRTAPPEYFPRYVRSHGPDGPGLLVEATGSYCKLIGLDKNPDATRGEYLDFAGISEAGFVKGLYELVTSVLMPQFRYRPHAWLLMESSTAKVADCEFNAEFREDAKLRGAYRLHPITHNTSLTADEIDQEERRSGGKGSAQCQRELHCELTRDPDDMVVPEFNEGVHVVHPSEWPMPKYALSHVGLDPGLTDPFGMVWLYFDWLRQCIVVQAAWAKANASTGEVARVTHDMEHRLWGTQHRAPNNPAEPIRHVRELSIADACKTGDGKVWAAPAEALTYWHHDEWSLKPNPYSRVSDIANRFVLDMNKDYGLGVRPAEKSPGSKEADTEHLRSLFEARPVRIVVLKNGLTEPLIQQLRSGEWDTDETGHRTDWKRTKTLGHLDCLAAGTMVATERGDVPIEQVRIGDKVWTRVGLRRVTAAWCAGIRETWTVSTDMGDVTGTPDHKIWSDGRWVHLRDLQPCDMLCGWESTDGERLLCSTGTNTDATRTAHHGHTAATSRADRGSAPSRFIGSCGSFITDLCQRAWRSITSTRTPSTTTYPTSKPSLRETIGAYTAAALSGWRSSWPISQTFAPLTGSGNEQTLGWRRPEPTGTSCEVASSRGSTSVRAACAGTPSSQPKRAPSFAEACADRSGDATQGETTSPSHALGASSRSPRTDTRVPSIVPARVRSVRPTGRTERVYDLTVDEAHEFIANGIVVSNCLAALKYVVRDVLWNRNPSRPPFVDPNQQLDHHVPDEIRDRARAPSTPTYGGRGAHSFTRNAGYRGR